MVLGFEAKPNSEVGLLEMPYTILPPVVPGLVGLAQANEKKLLVGGLNPAFAVMAISSWLKFRPYPPRITIFPLVAFGLQLKPICGPKFPFCGFHRGRFVATDKPVYSAEPD